MKVNAILLKPLDGNPPGTPRQFEKIDFDRLRGMSAVREAGPGDAVLEQRDDAADQMLERFRHPTDGPRLLAEMKASFERHETERSRLAQDLDAAHAAVTSANTARDAALDQLGQSRDVSSNLAGRIAELEKELEVATRPPAERIALVDEQSVELPAPTPAKAKR